MIPTVGRTPADALPTVLPDLLRAVDSVCRRHGVPPATAIVGLMVAAASGSMQIGVDGMKFMATAVEAWAYAMGAAEPKPPPEVA